MLQVLVQYHPELKLLKPKLTTDFVSTLCGLKGNASDVPPEFDVLRDRFVRASLLLTDDLLVKKGGSIGSVKLTKKHGAAYDDANDEPSPADAHETERFMTHDEMHEAFSDIARRLSDHLSGEPLDLHLGITARQQDQASAPRQGPIQVQESLVENENKKGRLLGLPGDFLSEEFRHSLFKHVTNNVSFA